MLEFLVTSNDGETIGLLGLDFKNGLSGDLIYESEVMQDKYSDNFTAVIQGFLDYNRQGEVRALVDIVVTEANYAISEVQIGVVENYTRCRLADGCIEISGEPIRIA